MSTGLRSTPEEQTVRSRPIAVFLTTAEIDPVVRSLTTSLGKDIGVALIVAEVEAAFLTYSGARVRQFVPILVERRVRKRLGVR